MQIKRLRITGFKSFVEPADLRIEPGLTGVVGPNGCGKSNLLEALRWTMGEGSAKSLRGAGMDDVIFAGTATRPPRDFAEVSILAEVNGDETEIVRRIERGAGSAYRIDGRDVRAKDVGLLFADAATGAHSPALVSQGRIGAVIAAKPADRRAMLEEAAGIAGLHVRRRDAEQRLHATEANLARLGELIAEQDVRAAALRRQARAADRYRTLSEQIRIAEARMIFARWREAAAASDIAKAEAKATEAGVVAATAAERVAAEAQAHGVERVAAARAAARTARDRAGEAGHALAALRTERANAVRRQTDLAATAARIVDDRAREDRLARDATDAILRLGAEASALAAAIETASGTAPALDRTLTDAERRARDAEVALARILAEQAGEAADRRIAAAAIAAARARMDRADRDAAQALAALAALPDPTGLLAERDAAAAAREGALCAATKAADALAWAEASGTEAREARGPAEAARATAIAALAGLDGEIAALTQANARGDGRLLDSISVVPGFERALAAALGDELQSPPDAWTGSPIAPHDPPPPPGTLPLAERITAPPALDRRLAQILLVEVDSGQELAVGQRLVTREGRLRRWDGYTADGGGAAAAERLERANRLAAIEAERPAAQAAVDRAEAARATLDERIARAATAAQGARTLLRTSEGEGRDAQRREDRAAAALERVEAQRSEGEARRTRLIAERNTAADELARAETDAAALPDGRALAATLATLQHQAEDARAAVATARAARLAHDRTLAASRERRAAVEAELGTWRARAGDAAGRIRDMGQREAELAGETDALAERTTALTAAIAAAERDSGEARLEADTRAAAEAAAETVLRGDEAAHRAAAEALSLAREARAGAVIRAEHAELRRIELGRVSGERFECPAPVLPERTGFLAAEVRSPAEESAAHERMAAERERIGPVNLVAARELAELEAASGGNAADRDELAEAVHRLRGSIGTLNREGRQRLRAAFEAVDAHFRTLFATLFDGGAAHLAMIDSDDPLEAGLEIMAQPPGKRLQSLTLLSGGEQALTAVALIFALFLTNPAPICVLDEVDAPLDDANIERFCDLLDRMSRDTATRYLVVTHNAVTMSRMHRLFGVTMVERGVSRLVSVDLRAAEGMAH
ncbi:MULTISPECIES: AAA family ATPase [unclassified Sphingomonas]|uniref:chromosome segregation SMC family protein n=1 Tax=unclassified Sphingomonas TaxID=196159 RepID=UPI0022699F57|nr:MULTISPECIES: AAA family ATPase [unclassified Sphingomonas]